MTQKVIPVTIDMPTPDQMGLGFFDMVKQYTKKTPKNPQVVIHNGPNSQTTVHSPGGTHVVPNKTPMTEKQELDAILKLLQAIAQIQGVYPEQAQGPPPERQPAPQPAPYYPPRRPFYEQPPRANYARPPPRRPDPPYEEDGQYYADDPGMPANEYYYNDPPRYSRPDSRYAQPPPVARPRQPPSPAIRPPAPQPARVVRPNAPRIIRRPAIRPPVFEPPAPGELPAPEPAPHPARARQPSVLPRIIRRPPRPLAPEEPPAPGPAPQPPSASRDDARNQIYSPERTEPPSDFAPAPEDNEGQSAPPDSDPGQPTEQQDYGGYDRVIEPDGRVRFRQRYTT